MQQVASRICAVHDSAAVLHKLQERPPNQDQPCQEHPTQNNPPPRQAQERKHIHKEWGLSHRLLLLLLPLSPAGQHRRCSHRCCYRNRWASGCRGCCCCCLAQQTDTAAAVLAAAPGTACVNISPSNSLLQDTSGSHGDTQHKSTFSDTFDIHMYICERLTSSGHTHRTRRIWTLACKVLT